MTQPALNKPPLLVFTDLDGSLLDHDTYDWQPASAWLTRLEQRAIPVIPTTSKTRAELLACNARLAEYRERRKQLSKRMLAGAWARKGAPVRCKSCISEAERAEAAQAAVNAANKAAIKAADGEIKQERCAGCSKMLAPSAFSRSQLLQKGEAKRCRACVGAAGASVGSSLLSEAVAAPRGAKLSVLRALPEPRPAVELARLKKLKRLGRYLLGNARMTTRYEWQGEGAEITGYSDSDWAGCTATVYHLYYRDLKG